MIAITRTRLHIFPCLCASPCSQMHTYRGGVVQQSGAARRRWVAGGHAGPRRSSRRSAIARARHVGEDPVEEDLVPVDRDVRVAAQPRTAQRSSRPAAQLVFTALGTVRRTRMPKRPAGSRAGGRKASTGDLCASWDVMSKAALAVRWVWCASTRQRENSRSFATTSLRGARSKRCTFSWLCAQQTSRTADRRRGHGK